MNANAKIGLAVAGGYLLGRTKKAKLALGFGMFLAGKKLHLDPGRLVGALREAPVLAGVSDQVRRELLDNARSAATSAVTGRVGSLADRLGERTAALRPGSRDRDATDEDELDEADEIEEPDEREEQEEESRPSRERTARRPATTTASRARTTASKAAGKATGKATRKASTKAPAKAAGRATGKAAGKSTTARRRTARKGDDDG
ncbi:hypothetical protein [Streptomyces sp. B6B3]|uniref:hypothetical protein n=1 Tax=Streptomyces sp. B6B3 TaxID=3153570 RepID=UPI00325E0158